MSMESNSSAEELGIVATLSRKERVTRKTSEMGNAAQESLAIIRRARGSDRQRRSRRQGYNYVKKMMTVKEETDGGLVSAGGCNGSTSHEEDEKAEVENKITALKRIVPGGESLNGVDKLFEETADYILALQLQVKALKFLASFVEGSEKEKRKLGG